MSDFPRNQRHLTEFAKAFSDWERNLRGWQVFDYAVNLEPAFNSIKTAKQIILPIEDNARIQGGIGRFFSRNQNNQRIDNRAIEDKEEKLPKSFYHREELSELQILLPKDLEVTPVLMSQFFLSLSSNRTPVSFEIIADSEKVTLQIACDLSASSHIKNQINTFFPSVFVIETQNILNSFLKDKEQTIIADFGLKNNFLFPLQVFKNFNPDPLTALFSSVGNLQENERVIVQILFQKAQNPWAEEINRVVFQNGLKSYFQETNSALLKGIKDKLAFPLFSCLLRIAVQNNNKDSGWQTLKRIGGSLSNFSSPNGNELIALQNKTLSPNNHFLSFLSRTSYRSGMLLNLNELASIIHLPSSSLEAKKLKREENLTKSAPQDSKGGSLILGENHHQNEVKEVSISIPQRTRHMHLIGASGSGKSNLMLNFIKQDLDNGNGLCVLDPHGDLIEEVVSQIPENRLDEVILFDPADSDYPIGFNILKANSESEKTLLASDLTASFRRLSTSWGDVMDSVLANTILAFVESDRGGTLFDLKRFLVEEEFREAFLETINDEAIKYFWQNEFPLLGGKTQSSILIRLDSFLRQKLIRNIVCQKESSLNFREIMDKKKILLLKLSQGAIGEENSYLLGTLLMSKLHQIALSRQDTSDRPFFALYIDEFQNFITPSMESVLSGIRKFNISLILANQEYHQMQSRNSEVASSVLSNCYTRICFRLGDADAEKFAKGFSFFEAKNLQNLGIGEAIARVERAEYDFNLKTFLLPKVDTKVAEERKQVVIDNSRTNYAKPRREVEKEQHFAKEIRISKPKSQAKVTPSVNQNKLDFSLPEKKPKEVTKQKDSNKKDGLGGEHHRDFQKLIKRVAESNGFSATTEKNILNGNGKVDISLENEAHKIAVEVSVTTNAKQELKNVKKCLKANYDYVVVVVSNQKKILGIKEKIELELESKEIEKVKVLSITGLLEFLWKLTNDKPKRKKKSKGTRLNVTEASEFLDKSPSTIYRWVQEGKLPFYKVGREYQFDREELALIGRHDLSGKGKANVELPPLEIKKRTPKTKKKQNKRYRKMLGLE